MKNEYSHEEPEPKQKGIGGQKNTADDLKFMRSVLEKSYQKVKPETHQEIMVGLVCMVAYISIHFLIFKSNSSNEDPFRKT